MYNEIHFKEMVDFITAGSNCAVEERFCTASREVPQFAMQLRNDHVCKVRHGFLFVRFEQFIICILSGYGRIEAT